MFCTYILVLLYFSVVIFLCHSNIGRNNVGKEVIFSDHRNVMTCWRTIKTMNGINGTHVGKLDNFGNFP